MKRILAILMVMSMLTACGEVEETKISQQSSQNYQNPSDLLGQEVGQNSISKEQGTTDFSKMATVEADIDLDGMSEIMRSAMMSNLMYDPIQYIGQTVKVSGQYMPFESQQFDATYHLLLYIDGSACCTGMLEFELPNGVAYPEEGDIFMIYGEYKLMSDETGEYAIIVATDYII